MPLPSLKLNDYADLELLAIITDVADGEGYATNADIAERVGIETKYANRCVSSRFSWMSRWGWVERHPEGSAWCLTEMGRDLLKGRLTKGTQNVLNRLTGADRVRLTRELARMNRSGSNGAFKMAQREWRREMT